MRTIRSFLALRLDLAVVEAMTETQKRLRSACREAGVRVRWVPPPNIHVTMRFLGPITESMAFAVKDMMEPIVAEVDEFDLEVVGLGAFPDVSRPRVIWAGLGQGSEVVGELHATIFNRLLKAGFNLDDRPFKAHVTLGRVKEAPPDALAACLGEDVSRGFGTTAHRHLYCYESTLSPAGAEYNAVWVLPFRKGQRKAAPERVEEPPSGPEADNTANKGE